RGHADRDRSRRDSRQHHAHHHGLHHRRWCDAAFLRRALGCGRADRLGLGPHHSPVGPPGRRHLAPPPSRLVGVDRDRTFPSGAFVVAVALGLAAAASAAGIADLMAPLLAARERGAFGSVDGRAYAEPQRGGGEPTPYPAVSIMLMPRSTAFDSE